MSLLRRKIFGSIISWVMDGIVKSWSTFSRRYPFPSTLATMDYIEGKDYWMEHSLRSCSFCFIFRGNGEFHQKGQIRKITAPCVMTLWPGDSISYGPFKPASDWDELLLTYDANCLDRLKSRGFFRESQTTWPIHNIKPVWSIATELITLASTTHPENVADRVDSACDRLILESLSPTEAGNSELKDALIEQIALYVNERLSARHDFDRLAEEHGLSTSTFRRRWLQIFHMPPWRYVLNLRIQLARRLLADSSLSVNKIAELCGYDDALYFSRRFRMETRVSPSEYRQQLLL